MSEITWNNNFLEINTRPSIMADKVEVKSLADITESLRNNPDINEEQLDEIAQTARETALTIADSINQKISDRKVTVKNLTKSDDELVLENVSNAENEINWILTSQWEDINSSLAELATTISSWNLKDKPVYGFDRNTKVALNKHK